MIVCSRLRPGGGSQTAGTSKRNAPRNAGEEAVKFDSCLAELMVPEAPEVVHEDKSRQASHCAPRVAIDNQLLLPGMTNTVEIVPEFLSQESNYR